MTIAHVNWIPEPAAWPGLIAKLGEQGRAARAAGLDLEVVVLNREREGGHGGISFRRIRHRDPGPPPRWQEALWRGRLILRSLDVDAYRAVVLRYPGAADLSLGELLARLGPRLVTEHHTDEPAELRMLARARGLPGWLKLAGEQAGAPRLLGGIAGLVAVTDEIRRVEVARGCRAPSLVIANGVDVDGLPATGCQPCDGRTLRLAFSCATFWPWQGLDRLLAGLADYRGGLAVELHLLGEVTGADDRAAIARLAQARPELRVIAHGVLARERCDQVLAQANLGISTLALQRKGMRQACPLKSREYAARGLPFVFAHDDDDVRPGFPGAERIAAGEGAIDIAALAEIAARLARPEVSAALRAAARSQLDWRPKLRRLDAFVRAVTR
jgi:glycosyltransferase involved in cell wall biosynthesis